MAADLAPIIGRLVAVVDTLMAVIDALEKQQAHAPPKRRKKAK